MNREDDEATVSVRQAREKIGKNQISRGGLYAAIRRGDVPHFKLGRKILISRAWLDRQLSGANDRE
jgi:hypothetical protein